MKKKIIVLKVFVAIFCFYTNTANATPLDYYYYNSSLDSRAQTFEAQTNSLYVRDVMRLAKAADMRNYMNESVDPCDDFYEFACGNWAKVNPTITQGETGYFYQLIEAIQRKKLALLRTNSTADKMETEIEKKVKNFYRSCMKAESVKQSDYKEDLKKLIAEFGIMPALDRELWNDTEFDWLSTIARIKGAYGKSIILGMDIMADIQNNTVNRIYIGPPVLPLKVRTLYLDEKNKLYRDNYRNKIKKEFIGAMELPAEQAMQIANEILNFEIELAKGLPDEKADSSEGESFFSTTVEEMQQKYAPLIDIRQYVQLCFGETIEGPIYEIQESYQKNLVHVIEATSKETLANYIYYQLMSQFVPDETGKGAQRMKYCEETTEIFFAELLENMIYRRFDFRNTERDIKLIFNEIKNAFRRRLQSNELYWISQNTREFALNKLAATEFEITSYKHLNFSQEFGEVQINESNFFENIKNLFENVAKNKKAEIYSPKPKKIAGLTYTPIFSHLDNTIKIPVALLQPNYFWAHGYPQAIKFGSIGALMGHEFVHGFADRGQQFDEVGNQNEWWDEKSVEAFQSRIECFREQYQKYTFNGISLPRIEDQSENVADNGGLRLAYEAYLGWHEEAERSDVDLSLEILPRMKYSDKQLFFLSFAQVWCNEIDSQFLTKKISSDEHTIAKFRVIGTLSNYEEFSKVFGCEADDPMNPKEKCVIY